ASPTGLSSQGAKRRGIPYLIEMAAIKSGILRCAQDDSLKKSRACPTGLSSRGAERRGIPGSIEMAAIKSGILRCAQDDSLEKAGRVLLVCHPEERSDEGSRARRGRDPSLRSG